MYSPSLYLAIIAIAVGPVVAGPAESVTAAWVDVQKVPLELRTHTRYLSLYHFTPEQRKEFLLVLAFHCNSLSRESDLVAPVLVGNDLVRVNMIDYGWTREVWEKLTNSEPYYHVRVDGKGLVLPKVKTIDVPVVSVIPVNAIKERVSFDFGKTWVNRFSVDNGRTWKIADEKVEAKKEEVKGIAAHAPWLPAQDITSLALATNSDAPIVRADWFIFQTAIQQDRAAGYYDFLGVGKEEKDFQELVIVDVKLAQRARMEMLASVARSGVTLNNRGIEWYKTIRGHYFRTQDYKSSTFKQNTLRLLDGDTEPPKGDASEQYGTLPNGLWAFWLQDGNGKRQDVAPDFIASDGMASGTDRRVHVGLSCIRCHETGIQPINDFVRRVYQGPLLLASPDYAKTKRLRQLYLSDLEEQVKDAQAYYAKRLKKLNGLTPEANARAYAKVWDQFVERDLGLEDVCRELNVEKVFFLERLKAYASKGGADPVLASLLANPPEPMRREHFEEVYSLAQAIVRVGAKP